MSAPARAGRGAARDGGRGPRVHRFSLRSHRGVADLAERAAALQRMLDGGVLPEAATSPAAGCAGGPVAGPAAGTA